MTYHDKTQLTLIIVAPPDQAELLPDVIMRKYAVDLQQQRRDADDVESNVRTIHKQKVKLYVRRGYAFRLAEGEELIAGELFYRKRPIGGFEKTGSIVPPNAL